MGKLNLAQQGNAGLTEGQARFLFHPYSGNRWINDVLESRDNAENDIQDHIERRYTDRDLQRVERSEAIARIDHLLSGKKIKLYFDKHSPLEVWLWAASAIRRRTGEQIWHVLAARQTQGQIAVSNRYFKIALRDYKDWRFAFWRSSFRTPSTVGAARLTHLWTRQDE